MDENQRGSYQERSERKVGYNRNQNKDRSYAAGKLVGEVVGIKFSHKTKRDEYYEAQVKVSLVGIEDVIPVVAKSSLEGFTDLHIGQHIRVHGSYRTYKSKEAHGNKVYLSCAKYEVVKEEEADLNEVTVRGFLCMPVNVKTESEGKKKCSMTLVINRLGAKDYIPAVYWYTKFGLIDNLRAGDEICVTGRMRKIEIKKLLNSLKVGEEQIPGEEQSPVEKEFVKIPSVEMIVQRIFRAREVDMATEKGDDLLHSEIVKQVR